MASFSVEAMVRGYHVYKDIWLLFNLGEELPCQHEGGNRADPFAVAVVRWEAIVGHVPKKISVYTFYLRRGLGVWKDVRRLHTTPSVLLSISNCSVVLVLESKF